MPKRKEGPTVLVAVKLPASLDRAVEQRVARDGIMKRVFVEAALRKHLEATNA